MATSNIPTGVKVIAILFYIGAALSIISGLLSLFGASLFGSVFGNMSGLGMIGAGFLFIMALFYIGIGILYIFIGRGLWMLKQWARITAIVLAVLGLLFAIIRLMVTLIANSIMGLILVLIEIILYSFIAGYLLFSNEVKKAFSSSR